MQMIVHFLEICVLTIVLVYWLSRTGRDDTDSDKGRSGLYLYTDHKTGVQYVGTLFALTPRLDTNGNPIITKPEEKHGQG